MKTQFLVLLVWLSVSQVAFGIERRIKDLTNIENDRTNVLTGMGLVMGLNGTGGETPVTREFLVSFIQRFGRPVDPITRAALRTDTRLKTKSMSVVTVTARLDTSAQIGNMIDVTVATTDEATDLNNGDLLPTPLRGLDGQVYAVASGRVATGGILASGDAASVQKNHPTTGYARAEVEKRVRICHPQPGYFRLLLRNPDRETARRIQDKINARYNSTAVIEESGIVRVSIPPRFHQHRDRFISMVQQERVQPDTKARVVINSQTGTVVVSENVTISTVAVTHGNISIITGESPQVSQPMPSARGPGETVVVPRTDIEVQEDTPPMTILSETTTVTELAAALNALGVSPQDLSSIFRILDKADVLHADLIIN